MTKDSRPRRPGKTLFPVLALLLLSGCRTDPPPKLSIVCILDGHGAGDCVDASGNRVYKLPSEMLNYWATTEVDQQNWASWCYGSSASQTAAAMAQIKSEALGSTRAESVVKSEVEKLGVRDGSAQHR